MVAVECRCGDAAVHRRRIEGRRRDTALVDTGTAVARVIEYATQA